MNIKWFLALGIVVGVFLRVDDVSATEVTINQPEPTVVRVVPIRADNSHNPILDEATNRYIVNGPPSAVPFNQYSADVLAIELGGQVQSQAKQAQAVAIRNYAWQRVRYGNNTENHPCFDPWYATAGSCDVTDSTLDQAFVAKAATQDDRDVVVDVQNYVLVYNHAGTPSSVPLFARYGKAHHGPFTEPAPDIQLEPYNASVYDPVANADDYLGSNENIGDGIGLAQDGALFYANGQQLALDYAVPQWNMHQILAHYYTSAELLIRLHNSTYLDTQWGDLRMNVVTHQINTPAGDGVYYTGDTVDVTVAVQNTGVDVWPAGTQLSARWMRDKRGYQEYFTESLIDLSALTPGQYETHSVRLRIPTAIYDGRESQYALVWDIKHGPQYGASMGWYSQRIPLRIRQRPAKPQPVPAQCPTKRPCPLNSPQASITWPAVEHPDTLVYAWRNLATASGAETSATGVAVALAPGTNQIDTLAAIAAEPTIGSAWTTAAESALVFYDPTPPAVTLTPGSGWTNAPSVQLTWSATDPPVLNWQNVLEPGSGIAAYVLDRSINNGPWERVVDDAVTQGYTAAALIDGATYAFRLSVTDHAGNTTIRNLELRIDRTAPTSVMIRPSTGTTTAKTWIALAWSGDDQHGSGVASYSIDYQVSGGVWQPWRINVHSTVALFQGLPAMTYALRVRAMDAAGNQEPLHPSADVTFTLGTDSTGLTYVDFPILLHTTQQQRASDDPYPRPK